MVAGIFESFMFFRDYLPLIVTHRYQVAGAGSRAALNTPSLLRELSGLVVAVLPEHGAKLPNTQYRIDISGL